MNEYIEEITDNIFDGGYKNHHHINENFRYDLEKILKKQLDKINFLLILKENLILKYEEHKNICTNAKTCELLLNKNSAIVIIDIILNDIK